MSEWMRWNASKKEQEKKGGMYTTTITKSLWPFVLNWIYILKESFACLFILKREREKKAEILLSRIVDDIYNNTTKKKCEWQNKFSYFFHEILKFLQFSKTLNLF